MPTRTEELRRVAAEAFGRPELRDEQLTAMEQLLAGHDVLTVLPTGAGISVIYQVPAPPWGGPTLVVSALIAPQRDQWEGLDATGAPDAVVVNSAQARVSGRGAGGRSGAVSRNTCSFRRSSWPAVIHPTARYGIRCGVTEWLCRWKKTN